MHLFVCVPRIDDHLLYIEDERVLKYMSRVLRMKVGNTCVIQQQGSSESTRWTISLLEVTKKHILGRIQDCKKNVKFMSNISLLVALPNTFSKCEFIVQKCTEVGVDAVYFWRAEKSIIPTISEKRLQRLQSIALESVEQCKRWSVPQVLLVDDPMTVCAEKQVVVFDFVEEGEGQGVMSDVPTIGVVGPEGHFGERDYAWLDTVGAIACSLGEHVLRTETAAMIGGWYLCNNRT